VSIKRHDYGLRSAMSERSGYRDTDCGRHGEVEMNEIYELITAFEALIKALNADGPERAVENMEELMAVLQGSAPEEWIDPLLENVGREVNPEIQRALATAWEPSLVDN